MDTTKAMHDPIEMGPFTFAIERAYDESSSPCGAIVVDLRLQQSDGAKVHFDDFLNDNTGRALILHPAMELVGADGRRYLGWVTRVSGREEWSAEFQLVNDDGWSEGAERCAASSHSSDFRLTIRNPDPRSGQPARVSMPLG